MKYFFAVLTFITVFSFSSKAQNLNLNFYPTVDLYEGIDHNFYSGSNFGVKNPIYSAYPVSGMIRHNRVDGLFIGYQEEKMDWNNSDFLGIENVDLHGLIGYSAAQKEIQYAIGAEKSIGMERKWLLLGGELYKSTSTEDYWRTGIYENSTTSFLTGFDYHDYFKADGFGFYTMLKPTRFIEIGASYNMDTFSSLEVNTDFSLISRYSVYRQNPAIDASTDAINQQKISLGLTLNPYGVSRNSFLWTTWSAKADLANVSGFDNPFHYNKYQLETKTYLRLDRSTLLKWRLMGGAITGEAPDFKTFAIGGIGSMRALGFKALKGNQMVLSNLELEFGKTSSNPDRWVDFSDFYLSLFLDSGSSFVNGALYTQQNPFTNLNFSFSDLSHNVGIGLGVGMFRFEVARPIAGTQGHSSFWIRLNPTF